ncbi:MAG: hypothetical protein NTW84_02425 [Methanothrix sp.]|nr:hypothetical protein [Methanothrix sp.]
MRFHLEASFRLSGDASAAEAVLADFFAGAAPILQKGAPEGHGAKIVQWMLAGDKALASRSWKTAYQTGS